MKTALLKDTLETMEQSHGPASPKPEDVRLARDTSRVLAPLAYRHKALKVRFDDPVSKKKELTLSALAVQLLFEVLSEMGRGNSVSLVPSQAELTTQQAADLLNVSRPFLVELLEGRKIPHHKVGSHRRVFVKDVLNYKARIDGERRKVLDELAKEAQDLKMGY